MGELKKIPHATWGGSDVVDDDDFMEVSAAWLKLPLIWFRYGSQGKPASIRITQRSAQVTWIDITGSLADQRAMTQRLWSEMALPSHVHFWGTCAADWWPFCIKHNIPALEAFRAWDGSTQPTIRGPSYTNSEYGWAVLKNVIRLCYPASSFAGPVSYHPDDPARTDVLIVRLESDPALPSFLKANVPVQVVGVDPHIPNDHLSFRDVPDWDRIRMTCAVSRGDETFPRIAFESMVRGIPVFTLGVGYSSQLFRGCHPVCGAREFPRMVTRAYGDMELLRELSTRVQKRYQTLYSAETARTQFLDMWKPFKRGPATVVTPPIPPLPTVASGTTRRRVAIICPWADQGLGIQARNYARLLDRPDGPWESCIFAYQPYFGSSAKTKGNQSGGFHYKRYQANPAEWDHPRITYVPRTRDQVTTGDVNSFVTKFHPECVLLPEICGVGVFRIADAFKSAAVRVLAIPNIELCSDVEVPTYAEHFSRVLCNNMYSANILRRWVPEEKLAILGFAMPWRIPKAIGIPYFDAPKVEDRRPIRFLHLAGNNGATRKYTAEVCEAFAEVQNLLGPRYAMELTVGMQQTVPGALAAARRSHSINVLDKALTYMEVERLYATHHVVIHTSKQEGLGLGFYEALSHGCPVVSLRALFYPEVVPENAGWLVPAREEPDEHIHAVTPAACFDIPDLVATLRDVVLGGSAGLATKVQGVMRVLRDSYDPAVFVGRMEGLLE